MDKWILAGFGGVLVLLIGNGAVAYRNLQTLVANERMVVHTHEVQREIERLLSDLKDMESGQRSYLLTGEEVYLNLYEMGRRTVPHRVQRLRELTSDNTEQRRRLAELEPLVAARFETLADLIALRRDKGLDAAREEVLTGEGRGQMTQIRQLIAAMVQAEDALLLARSRQSRASARLVVLEFAMATVLAVGAVASLFGLYRRDTAQRRVAHAELEKRVIQRTAELEAANKELEAFSYTVSHDLRAPLRAIDGFSRILLDEFAASLPAECQEYLADVRANTQHMGRLVDDLLAFARLSRLPLRRQTIDAAEQVQQTLDDLQPEVAGRNVELRVGQLPEMYGDPALLKQVWANLLSNALKYTGKCPAATIEVGSLATANGEPTFFVKDNGVGFDMRYAHKLFGVFQRLNRSEDYAGTGVGLAIVERIVHRHGGRIWAEAKPNEGATFFFTIPSSEASHA
jgi:signal transduction histidine kinase